MEPNQNLMDPRRCQANTPFGQCTQLAVEGSKYCTKCTRQSTQLAPRMKQYFLTGDGEAKRIAELADSETIKSLRETAAIANRVLERYYNLAKTDADFLAYGGAIDRQLKTVEKVVKSMVELDEKVGSVLSQEQLIVIIRSLAQIIHDELKEMDGYEEVEDRIGSRFAELLCKKRQPPAIADET